MQSVSACFAIVRPSFLSSLQVLRLTGVSLKSDHAWREKKSMKTDVRTYLDVFRLCFEDQLSHRQIALALGQTSELSHLLMSCIRNGGQSRSGNGPHHDAITLAVDWKRRKEKITDLQDVIKDKAQPRLRTFTTTDHGMCIPRR